MGTPWGSDHFVVYESDEGRFGGHKRLDGAHNIWFEILNEKTYNRDYTIRLYIPSRTCIVLCSYEKALEIGGDIAEMPTVTER